METAYLQAGKVDPLEENANLITLGIFSELFKVTMAIEDGCHKVMKILGEALSAKQIDLDKFKVGLL